MTDETLPFATADNGTADDLESQEMVNDSMGTIDPSDATGLGSDDETQYPGDEPRED